MRPVSFICGDNADLLDCGTAVNKTLDALADSRYLCSVVVRSTAWVRCLATRVDVPEQYWFARTPWKGNTRPLTVTHALVVVELAIIDDKACEAGNGGMHAILGVEDERIDTSTSEPLKHGHAKSSACRLAAFDHWSKLVRVTHQTELPYP